MAFAGNGISATWSNVERSGWHMVDDFFMDRFHNFRCAWGLFPTGESSNGVCFTILMCTGLIRQRSATLRTGSGIAPQGDV